MIHAIYPGSFDPITNGHLDIIQRTVHIFNSLTIAVLVNPQKNPLFSVAERKRMVADAVVDMETEINIDEFDGLLVDYAGKINAQVIIRGLRAVSDFEFEFQLSLMNQRLKPEINTVYLMAREDLIYLSSGLIKEIAFSGGDIREFVPLNVARKIQEKIS